MRHLKKSYLEETNVKNDFLISEFIKLSLFSQNFDLLSVDVLLEEFHPSKGLHHGNLIKDLTSSPQGYQSNHSHTHGGNFSSRLHRFASCIYLFELHRETTFGYLLIKSSIFHHLRCGIKSSSVIQDLFVCVSLGRSRSR